MDLVASEVVTAALLNTHLRDDLLFLYTPPMVRAYNSAAISLTNNVEAVLTYDSERFDTDTMHSTSSNTGRLTKNSAGKYIEGAHAEFAANATGYRQSRIRHQTSTAAFALVIAPVNSAAIVTVIIATGAYAFAVNDYSESLGYQNSGGALNVNASAAYSLEFWSMWQGN